MNIRLVQAFSSLVLCFIAAVQPCSVGAQILGSAALNVERRGHTATVLTDGRILFVGGENAAGPVSQSEIFNPSSRTFSAGGSSAPRTDHAAALLADGQVLVTGGRDAESALDSTEFYNPVNNSFSSGPLMQRARSGHTATVLADGKILLAGGDAEGSAEIYDPDAQSFALIGARLKTPRAFHGAALLQDGRVLIAGGVAGGGVLDSAELFDPQTSSFTPALAPMGVARGLPLLRVLPDGKTQIIGGDAEWSMEMFDPASDSFTALAHLPPTSDLLSATLSSGGRAALITTTIAENPAVQAALADPELAKLLDRADHSITELPQSNRALVAGGVNGSGEFLSSSVLVGGSSASVTTDAFDYAPGHSATITGAGWQPHEPVSLLLHEEPETHADSTILVVADKNGEFSNRDFAPAPNDVGRTFTLTAIGQRSGRTAQTAFTDTDLRILTITGNGVACGGATPCQNPIHLTGDLSTIGNVFSNYRIQIDWGDGVAEFADVNFTFDQPHHNFSAVWASNPDHTYTSGGAKTITVKLSHDDPPVFFTEHPSPASVTINVGKRATATSISCATPVDAGQGAACTATVSDNDGPGGSVPTGTVTFSTDADGSFSSPGVTCTLGSPVGNSSSCAATYTPASALAALHHIGAHYNGSTAHETSDAATFNLSVNKRSTTTAVAFGADPVDVGQNTTATITVTDTDANGTKSNPGVGTIVTVSSDSGDTITGTCTLAALSTDKSTCQVTVKPTHASTHKITASFAATTVHSGSDNSPGAGFNVNKRSTTAAVAFGTDPVDVGQNTIATITVTDTDANGTKSNPGVGNVVAIASDSGDTITGTCTLAALSTDKSTCSVTITPTHASIHKITATFAPTTVHSGSDNSPGAGFTVNKRSTTTAVAFGTDPVDVGQNTLATITVTDTDANGTKSNPGVGTIVTVSSDSGDTITGTCTLAALSTDKSTCQVTVTPTHASTHKITANFAATTVHSASDNSPGAGFTVNKRSTTTAVAFGTDPVDVGQNTIATITVTDTDANGAKSNPGVGNVVAIASDSGDTITGTCTLAALSTDKSTCQVTITPTHASTHKITASFAATTVHSGSDNSPGAAFNVNKRGTTTAVTFSANPVVVGQSTTATVIVTDNDANGTKSNPGVGNVVAIASDSGDTITGTCTLAALSTDKSTCQVTVTPTHASTHKITATFAATTVHSGSDNSPGAGFSVGARHTTTAVSFGANPVVVGQSATATVTVTDDDSGGAKSNPGVGTTVSVTSDSGDTIGGTCTLAALSTDKSTCQVTVTPTHASIHTISATFSATTVHAGGGGNSGLTVNKRATTTGVVFASSSVIETDGTTATVTVTDTDPNGAKSNPGVGTTVSVTSDSGDTIGGTCTLAALNADQSTCQVSVTPTHASIHTITATFSATAVHAGSAGNGQLTVEPHTLVIQNLSFTPVGSTTSPKINVSHDISDNKGDQTRDHVITSAQNIPRGCTLAASAQFSTQYDRSIVGLSNTSFKAWEIGKSAWSAAKKKKCSAVELKITSYSVQSFHKIGNVESPSNVLDLTQDPFTGSISVCFSVSTGAPLSSCPLAPVKKNLARSPSVAARLTGPDRN